jgi:hypothetical protein
MKGMKKEHNKDTIEMIKYIIFHKDYEKYINVFDRDNSTSIIDIEETILFALKKGD